MRSTGLQVRRLALPALMLLAAAAASHAASRFIDAGFPNRPEPADLLFETLPYVDAAQYASDLAVFTAIALLAYYGVTKVRTEIPRMMAVFASMYLLRASMIVLTPLAPAHGEGVKFGFVPYIQNGMWPSGHTGATLLCFLLVDGDRAPCLKRTTLALAVIEWVSLLLARGHYSIDIIGGLLLSYFVYHEWTHGRLFNPVKRLVEGPGA